MHKRDGLMVIAALFFFGTLFLFMELMSIRMTAIDHKLFHCNRICDIHVTSPKNCENAIQWLFATREWFFVFTKRGR